MKETAMADPALPEDTPRALAVALAIWAAAVSLGAADGVFARLGPEVDFALASFGALFALGTYALDAGVRGAVHRVPAGLLAVGALVPDAGLGLALDAAPSLEALARGPLALLAFFGMPLALVAHAALAAAALSSAPAKSPVSRPAAT
jgi:hypothetical protein